MERWPHLTDQRGDAARELFLQGESQRASGDDREETLRAVECAAEDALREADALLKVAAAELSLTDRAQVHAVRARDPVGKRDRTQQIRHDDSDYRHVGILLAAWTTACSVASWRGRSPRRSSTRTTTSWRSTTSSRARRSTCWSCRGSTWPSSRSLRTRLSVASCFRRSGASPAREASATTS